MDLEGKVAVITGGSSGIGAETAGILAERGCRVAINYQSNAAGADEVVAGLASEGLAVQGNVAEDADCRRIAESVIDKWGRIDALVNNAGTTKFADPHDLDALSKDDFLDMYAINTVGPWQMTRACAPQMKATGHGAVVNVSTIGAVTGMASSAAYCASKAALNTLTLTLARTLAPEIRVNCICPGLVDSRWNRSHLGDEKYETVKATYEATTPLQHACTPEDIAKQIVWMIEGADWMTGEIVMVDSGLHLGFAPLQPK